MFSVAGDCKKQGLSVTKKDISKSCDDVQMFYSLAKFVNGKKAQAKSTNFMCKRIRKRQIENGDFSKFWSEVEQFESSRKSATCVIISCCATSIDQCYIDQPVLIISAKDLNCLNFCYQLGMLMLEPRATVCVETAGLSKEGAARLARFLQSASELFDSRIRLVIFSPEELKDDVRKYIEEDFVVGNVLAESVKRIKTKETLEVKEVEKDTVNKKEVEKDVENNKVQSLKEENINLRKKLAVSNNEISDLKLQLCERDSELKDSTAKTDFIADEKIGIANELNTKCKEMEKMKSEQSNMEKEIANLKFSLMNMKTTNEKQCFDREEYVKKLTVELSEIEKEYALLSEKVSMLMNEIKVKTNENITQHEKITELEHRLEIIRKENYIINELEQVSTIAQTEQIETSGKQTQTKFVEIILSPVSVIKANMSKYSGLKPDTVDLVYRSIKDFKCDVMYSDTNNGTQCAVKITSGKQIMKCPELLNFAGEGPNKDKAKLNAFEKFVNMLSKADD